MLGSGSCTGASPAGGGRRRRRPASRRGRAPRRPAATNAASTAGSGPRRRLPSPGAQRPPRRHRATRLQRRGHAGPHRRRDRPRGRRQLVLVDDASTDDTVRLARSLGLAVHRHEEVRGYGGNQKSCYRLALALGADIVVMVHPDYQYSPRLVPAMAAMIAYGQYDFVLGSRSSRRTPSPRACRATSMSPTASSPWSRTPSCARSSPSTTPGCAPTAGSSLPPCPSSATPRTSCSTTRSSPRRSPPAPGSASSPARPGTRRTRPRSTCAGASPTASACSARPPSTPAAPRRPPLPLPRRLPPPRGGGVGRGLDPGAQSEIHAHSHRMSSHPGTYPLKRFIAGR